MLGQFQEVPREVILSIFNETSPNDQIRLAQVCKLFNGITKDKSSKLTQLKQRKINEEKAKFVLVGALIGCAITSASLRGCSLFWPSQLRSRLQSNANAKKEPNSNAPEKKNNKITNHKLSEPKLRKITRECASLMMVGVMIGSGIAGALSGCLFFRPSQVNSRLPGNGDAQNAPNLNAPRRE